LNKRKDCTKWEYEGVGGRKITLTTHIKLRAILKRSSDYLLNTKKETNRVLFYDNI